jgi:CopG family nickel-responsive transcriptional regulator
MKSDLVRFGVAMDRPLLDHLDVIVNDRGVTRSEILRDLVRAEVVRAQVPKGVPAFAALTIVYDHHVRDLTERLTAIQHDLGDRIRSTLHVHVDHHHCLEVIIMRGRSDELQRVAEKLLATRGVKHGGIEIVTQLNIDAPRASHAGVGGAAGAHGHTHAPLKKPRQPSKPKKTTA